MKNDTLGFVYFTACVGAAVYFVRTATTFGIGLLGIVKALFWPAVLMYRLLEWLKM